MRKDRNSKARGGGVFIAVRQHYDMTLLPDLETNCEILWAKVQISASKSLTLGCFYRPPDSKISTSEELVKSLDLMPKNSNQTIVLGGDFNLPGIDWDNGVVNPKAANKSQCELLLSSLDTHALAQIHKEPTREENILDLLITNKPGLIKSSHSVPGISDHCAVVTELDIDPPYRRTKPRPVRQFKKANWEAIRQQIRSCWTSFSENSPSRSVNENWLKLKSILNQCLNKFIPTKMTSPRENLPWLSKSLLASIRKKTSLYSRAERTNKAYLWAKYKLCKRQTQRAIRSARWSFLKNKHAESLEQKNSKPLWRYIKSKRQDENGVSPLKENGQLHSDSRRKAEILNNQFCSVFTSEDTTNIPKLAGPPNTEMPKFEITVQGVTKLLEGLNGGKASGLDKLPNLILKNAAKEISPFLKIIFDQSLQTGKLPDDWVEANVAPVFKKRDRHSPANYRPISLTCVCAKLLEHIICKQIMSHFSENKILTPVQHGFRSKHSCESQLLITTDEFIRNFESKTQTDVVVLDFSKAFDVVPHQRLLHKLDHYGIRGTTLNWIKIFLTNRTQKVVVDGSSSESARVRSGVPQGTVLGPLLFLTYINDLPSTVSSQVRLFADDCLLYRPIKCRADQEQLQRDLSALQDWADRWGMCFNPSKCSVLRVSRPK